MQASCTPGTSDLALVVTAARVGQRLPLSGLHYWLGFDLSQWQLAVLNSLLVSELWKILAAKNAAAGGRLSAPGEKEVFLLDLGASRDIYHCRLCFICFSS